MLLAVGAAENVERVALVKPALHLLEERPAHLLGNFGFRRARIERPERIERGETEIDVRRRRIDGKLLGKLHRRQPRLQRVLPIHEELVAFRNLARIILGGFR